jgi:hypothetical protein
MNCYFFRGRVFRLGFSRIQCLIPSWTRIAEEEDLIESNLAASQVAAELDAVNEEDTATLQNTEP